MQFRNKCMHILKCWLVYLELNKFIKIWRKSIHHIKGNKPLRHRPQVNFHKKQNSANYVKVNINFHGFASLKAIGLKIEQLQLYRGAVRIEENLLETSLCHLMANA